MVRRAAKSTCTRLSRLLRSGQEAMENGGSERAATDEVIHGTSGRGHAGHLAATGKRGRPQPRIHGAEGNRRVRGRTRTEAQRQVTSGPFVQALRMQRGGAGKQATDGDHTWRILATLPDSRRAIPKAFS